jgi:hypothetical protein
MTDEGAEAAWAELIARRTEHQWAACAELSERFIAQWPSSPRRRKAEVSRLYCFSRLEQWSRVESLARLAMVDFPKAPEWTDYLAEALFRLGRRQEALELVQAAIAANPGRLEPRALRATLTAEDAPARPARKVRIWPTQAAFEDARRVVQTYLLRGLPAVPLIRPETVFMTLGSCFADNLAARLRQGGYAVHAEGIGEEVNSTYANRYLLEWIERGAVNGPTAVMDEFYGPQMRERFARALDACNIFVLTLGVAPAFFQEGSGDFVFMRPRSATGKKFLFENHVMRTTSVAENVENVHAMIDAVRRLSPRNPHVVLTVSPVPLGATTEFHSAAIADSLSKSTMRLACHEVVTARAKDGVHYWPSFEIVRWFGPHFGRDLPRIYGAHDGDSRHVSSWLVDLIVELFLEHYADARREPVA